jgi:hypothetical protein
MASSEDVKRVFNARHFFEVSGSRVDLWQAAESEDPRGERIVAHNLRGTRAAQAGQDTGQEKSQKALQPLAMLVRRLIQTLVPSSRTVKP